MNASTCRQTITKGQSRPGFVRHSLNLVQWLVPGTVLVLMPKCPVCLAAYIALGTGIGLSLPVATYLRLTLLAVCAISLAFLLVRSLRRARQKTKTA